MRRGMRAVVCLFPLLTIIGCVSGEWAETEPAKLLRYYQNDNAKESQKRYQTLETWAKDQGAEMGRVGIAVSQGAVWAGSQTLALRENVQGGVQLSPLH